MNSTLPLPAPIAAYLKAIHSHDTGALESTFAADAVVKDVGREIHGIAAITEWANREIFGVNVRLEVMKIATQDDVTILTVSVDGDFDRTGLPNPLIMDQLFRIADGKIVSLTCQFAAE